MITIRRTGPADLETISGMLHAAEGWLRGRGIAMWTPEELDIEPLRRDVAGGMHWLAEVGGNPAGTVRFQLEDELFWPDLTADEAAASAFVHRLAVDRRFAGTGVGAALLDWCAGLAREQGRRYLRLDCDADRPRLRAFYERCGFVYHSDRQVGVFLVARYARPVE